LSIFTPLLIVVTLPLWLILLVFVLGWLLFWLWH
jgi:hypothetical protein